MRPVAIEQFCAALRAYAGGNLSLAARHAASAAAADRSSALALAGARHLERAEQPGAGVYVTGEAFAAFIRGGGNLGLYQAVSDALRSAYDDHQALALLDIGVGDGMALLPALAPQLARLQLVEPSAAMLARTLADLAERGIAAQAFEGTIQDFLAQTPANARWDVAQATFSLQSLPRGERLDVLRRLRQHTGRLLIAEFDVPAVCDEPLSSACMQHLLARYEQGVAEYAGDGGLVVQGFLMPVLFSIYDSTAARTNYEQPIERWAEDLRAAGFGDVRTRTLFDYWWAPAVLLDARG